MCFRVYWRKRHAGRPRSQRTERGNRSSGWKGRRWSTWSQRYISSCWCRTNNTQRLSTALNPVITSVTLIEKYVRRRCRGSLSQSQADVMITEVPSHSEASLHSNSSHSAEIRLKAPCSLALLSARSRFQSCRTSQTADAETSSTGNATKAFTRGS